MVLLFALAVITNAQTLRVQILNGKTGKPVANEHVNLFRSEGFGDLAGKRGVAGFTTDADGTVTTSEIAPEVHALFVSVDWHRQCSENEKVNRISFSLQEIFVKGVVSENTCKPKVTRTALPGTLVLFVRDETFFEKMAH
jgi:5-hydroxyisourate hydrolase-like protein (transthyretin family)